ncbi:MAG: hypothetical protein WBD34_21670 [Burkholderiaceae bacterium]
MTEPSSHLLLHGSIVLLYAFLCGIPYGRAITGGASERTVAAWRLAHSSLSMGAILMLVTSQVMPGLIVSSGMKWFIASSLIVSSYAFCVALTIGPIVGHRGLTSGGPLSAKVVYLGNLVGAGGSLFGALGLVWSALASLWK